MDFETHDRRVIEDLERQVADLQSRLDAQIAGHRKTAKDATDNLIRANEAERALAERAGGVSHDMRWPKAGDKMRFLNENGYDAERERAARVFAINQDYTVKDISIGSWSSSIYFEEVSGGWNSVMFGFPEATLATEPAAPES